MSTNIDVRSGSYLALQLRGATLADGVANTTIQDTITVPVDAELVAVYGASDDVTVVAAGTDPSVDVFHNRATPATVLSAAVVLAADDTSYAGTVSIASFKAGDILTLRCVTGSSSGALVLPTVTLLFKVEPPALA